MNQSPGEESFTFFSTNTGDAALRSSPRPFYHKRVIDRVLAAPAICIHPLITTNWPYSPSSLRSGKGMALSQPRSISTTKAGLKEEGEWNGTAGNDRRFLKSYSQSYV